MNRNSIYYKQVQLLMQVLPFIARQSCFALKGGTAINLFIRAFPRLSVDIDLVYLPLRGRLEALAEIKEAMRHIGEDLRQAFADITITQAYKTNQEALRLIVGRQGVQIKVELSPVLRGTVYPPQQRQVCAAVEEAFGYAQISVMALADLYAGKICAALDRQHPRDLFDVMGLLENEGLGDEIMKALLIYLCSHNRPIAELLRPKYKTIDKIYLLEFSTMAQKEVSLEQLLDVRNQLVELIHQKLTDKDKAFLLSFKRRSPDWSLIGIDGISKLPAIQWKLKNLANMPNEKHELAVIKLKSALGLPQSS